MRKLVEVGYIESSKAVSAKVKVIYEADTPEEQSKLNETALAEAKALYKDAGQYSKMQSLEKLRG